MEGNHTRDCSATVTPCPHPAVLSLPSVCAPNAAAESHGVGQVAILLEELKQHSDVTFDVKQLDLQQLEHKQPW